MKKSIITIASLVLSVGFLGACNTAEDPTDTENMRYENVRYNNFDNGRYNTPIDYDEQEPDLGEEPSEQRRQDRRQLENDLDLDRDFDRGINELDRRLD